MSTITMLQATQIRPNEYNPNEMTPDEFAELVAEVRHLSRVPKPIIVRPTGEGYVIVDGEHGWRAAQEVGITEMPCEVLDIDDFEAMRQTYKRNQHGEHNPMRLGAMFDWMMRERDLSQRALAKEIEVSEGTIRNALLYSEASRLRNSYAFENLSVRQVREYLALPFPVRDYWLDAGADPKVLDEGLSDIDGYESGAAKKMTLDGPEWWHELVRDGFAVAMAPSVDRHLTAHGFAKYARRAFSLRFWAQHMAQRMEGANDFALAAARTKAPQAALEMVRISTATVPAKPLLSVEQWEDILQRCAPRANKDAEWRALIDACLDLELRDVRYDYADPRVMMAVDELKAAPDFIRDADLDLSERLFLARATAALPDDALLEAKREAISYLNARNGWLRAAGGDIAALGVLTGAFGDEISTVQQDAKFIAAQWQERYGIAEKAFDAAAKEVSRQASLRQRNELFADAGALLDAAIQNTKRNHTIREEAINGMPAYQVLRERIAALPEPERRLLCGLLWNGADAQPVSLHTWFNQMKAHGEAVQERQQPAAQSSPRAKKLAEAALAELLDQMPRSDITPDTVRQHASTLLVGAPDALYAQVRAEAVRLLAQ